MARRTITTEFTEEDAKIEGSLRPQLLAEYIGQQKGKKNLKVYIEAEKRGGKRLTMCFFLDRPDWGRRRLPW